MVGRNELIAAILVILIIALVFLYFYLSEEKYAYEVQLENIAFKSNEYPEPKAFLKEVKERYYFIISPELDHESKYNTYVNSINTLFVGVLNGLDKNAVTVIRVLNERNELDYCQTNYGSIEANERISAEECMNLLGDESAVKIKASLPNDSLRLSEVILSKNSIEIKPKTASEGTRISALLLKAMYEETEEIIEVINTLAKKLSG